MFPWFRSRVPDPPVAGHGICRNGSVFPPRSPALSRSSLSRAASLLVLLAAAPLSPVLAQDAPPPPPPPAADRPDPRIPHFVPQQKVSDGSVTVRGQKIDYQAVAGTLVVHPKGWSDADALAGMKPDPKDDKQPTAEAAMFYVAYVRKNVRPENRPITFVYNGGPGSATVWLHMGAFGPRRVVTADDVHTAAAPYQVVNNDDSLLDATDLVFIDAPGTGFGRIAGKDAAKLFYGTDPDAQAFADFITQFLGRYGRYESPKYLFGESYGTTRSAVVADLLQEKKGIDLNGVMLLSQILDYDNSIDGPTANPSVDQPYVLALPSYAATAAYHHKLANQPADLPAFLKEVEQYATTDYAAALQLGTALPDDQRDRVAARLHDYTGLPVDYIRKANLRVNGGEFEQTLLGTDAMITGRLDSRFSGYAIDPLSQSPDYDPMGAAMGSAYMAAFNDYARKTLHYGDGGATGDGYEEYKQSANNIREWNFHHDQPNAERPGRGLPNVLPDLAAAMIVNPKLHVQLNQGYYDLGTPYFEGVWEMRHLPIPHALAGNVEIRQYQSGHMVYAHQDALVQLHDNAADFIRRTENQNGPGAQPMAPKPNGAKG
ncbi:MAG: peptidase S10 [Gluconacetobacter diazotrophicus]|nr:peptidase S10 [Gluconacetobacter diazotrophicus]